jgi:hypothetical protein
LQPVRYSSHQKVTRPGELARRGRDQPTRRLRTLCYGWHPPVLIGQVPEMGLRGRLPERVLDLNRSMGVGNDGRGMTLDRKLTETLL